jgi:hypothetical protein
MAQDRKDVGALWIVTDQQTGQPKKDRNGNVFLNGTVNGQRVTVFRNSFKKPGEKTPDYRVFPQEQSGGQSDPLGDGGEMPPF